MGLLSLLFHQIHDGPVFVRLYFVAGLLLLYRVIGCDRRFIGFNSYQNIRF